DTARHTSFKARLEGDDAHLVTFVDGSSGISEPIGITRRQYVDLVHWSSCCIRSAGSRRVPFTCRPILRRMQLSQDQWSREISHYGRWYYRAVGSLRAMERYCSRVGRQWLKGIGRLRSCPGSLTVFEATLSS